MRTLLLMERGDTLDSFSQIHETREDFLFFLVKHLATVVRSVVFQVGPPFMSLEICYRGITREGCVCSASHLISASSTGRCNTIYPCRTSARKEGVW